MGATGGSGAGIASLASMGLSAYGSILKGQGEQAGDEYRASRLERSAQIGRVAATEVSDQLTESLNQTLGNIDATRAAAHTDPTSPTGAAVRDYEEMVGTRQRNIQVENILAQSQQQEADAAYLRSAGKYAMLGGEISAAAGVAGGLGKTDWSTFGVPGGKKGA